MYTKGQIHRIIWAVDAFEERETLEQKAAQLLGIFQEKISVEIEPVFVLASSEMNWLGDFNSSWMEEFQRNLQTHLEEVLLTAGHPFMVQPKIILEPLASTSAAVESLLDYSQRKNADMIVVSSHRRRGLDRFFVGSFAETLLVHAQVPVLVVGQGVRVEAECRRVLFPTDFGGASRQAFRRVVSAARQIGAELTLFHAVPMPAQIVMDTGYYPSLYGVEGEMVTYDDFIKAQMERQSRRADSWAQWAQQEGVNCKTDIDVSGSAVDELICDLVSKEKFDLVMMEAHSGPVKVTLLGSITRNVVRKAQCPVLVFPRESLYEAPVQTGVESETSTPLEFGGLEASP